MYKNVIYYCCCLKEHSILRRAYNLNVLTHISIELTGEYWLIMSIQPVRRPQGMRIIKKSLAVILAVILLAVGGFWFYCRIINHRSFMDGFTDLILTVQHRSDEFTDSDAGEADTAEKPETDVSTKNDTDTPAEKPTADVDYGDAENWAYYRLGEEKAVDTFLICPTVDMRDEFNMAIDDTETKASFLGALNMERGIYEESSRMFAPYYRMAAMKVYSLEPTAREPYLEFAYSDISSAFAWYLEHENEGRPIILAGFSQGADMCYRLLEEYFDHEELFSQLVAVYAIGWPCTQEMTEKYPQIRPASSENDVGVVISFDCEAPDVEETLITPAGTKARTINPLNWRTDSEPADRSENLGACFTDYSGEIIEEEAGLCGCYIEETRGVLKVTDLDSAKYPPMIPGLQEGAYHIYDYQFFFRALQKNVQTRVESYFADALLSAA